jgi:outer membrane lipoprotein-sorting protein
MRFFAGLLLCLSLSPALASTPAPTDSVRSRITQPATLRGHFEQEKQLQGFRNPLRSRGTLLLLRDRGVAWDTTAPFASSTVLSRERLVSTLPDGSSRVLLDAGASPAMAAVNSLLLALVAGDLDALAPQFTIEETLKADGAWSLRLTPREPALQRVFASIELDGDRYVREVRIAETAGDRSTIRFVDLTETPDASADEAARFD